MVSISVTNSYTKNHWNLERKKTRKQWIGELGELTELEGELERRQRQSQVQVVVDVDLLSLRFLLRKAWWGLRNPFSWEQRNWNWNFKIRRNFAFLSDRSKCFSVLTSHFSLVLKLKWKIHISNFWYKWQAHLCFFND